MGGQSASRLSGDDYQHLYSWYELLHLLDADSPYEYAFVEHPDAGSADDVTLHAKPDSSKPSRFVQIKWHQSYSELYSFTSLAEITSGVRSVLRKLYDTWKDLRQQGPVEVWLVSNWGPAPEPDLGAYLVAGRKLAEKFFLETGSKPAANARQQWREALNATEAELTAFCRDLRLELGYHDLQRFEEQFNDRMGDHDLNKGENARAIALHEIRQRIERGGDAKRLTKNDLEEIIQRRGLRTQEEDSPVARLWIHGWAHQAYDDAPTVELDWTKYFSRPARRIATEADWESTLWPDLERARDKLSQVPGGKYVDVRGKLPLTASVALGYAMSEVAGFRLRVEQPSGGITHLWRSDAAPSDSSFVIQQEKGQRGADLTLGLGVSGDSTADVGALHDRLGNSALIYAEPDRGTGPAAVRGANDATALAHSAKELMRKAQSRYGVTRVHLAYFGPVAVALFLGQLLNAVGTVVTYERASEGGYQQSVIIETG